MTSQSGGGLVGWPVPTDSGPGGTTPGGGVLTNWPLHDVKVGPEETLVIGNDKQYILWQRIEIEGSVIIEDDGELVILGHGIPEETDPDMTYVNGDLTQIDYGSGEQRIFNYSGGDLNRVDFLQDGTTLRKDLFYSGGDLDYIDEYYI